MTARQSLTLLIVATAFFAAVFLGMTWDTLRVLPKRTNEDHLSARVIEGKQVWQSRNCNDCHTILGIGGYYAPDLTKVYRTRGPAYIKAILKDPETMTRGRRQMPNLKLGDPEITALAAFLEWVSNIDTNRWPPEVEKAMQAQAADAQALLDKSGCLTCHSLTGDKSKMGPPLNAIGSRRSQDWILDQINHPEQHNSQTSMPSFAHLPEEQKTALASFLASLK